MTIRKFFLNFARRTNTFSGMGFKDDISGGYPGLFLPCHADGASFGEETVPPSALQSYTIINNITYEKEQIKSG